MAISIYARRTASIDRESTEMIVDYADKRTERFASGEFVREFESIVFDGSYFCRTDGSYFCRTDDSYFCSALTHGFCN